MDISIAWSVTAAEAVRHPDVERLPTGQLCEGWMSSKNYRGPRDPAKGACKVSARWRYTAPNPGALLTATSGVYCWKHLVYTGICGGNDEAYRTAEWLTALRATRPSARVCPRCAARGDVGAVMIDYSQWNIRVAGGLWWLEHVPCGWVSNDQGHTDVRSLEDLHRWIGNHACAVTS